MNPTVIEWHDGDWNGHEGGRKASVRLMPMSGEYFWHCGWMAKNGECGQTPDFSEAERKCQEWMSGGAPHGQ